MDREIVDGVRRANEACIAMITLLINEENEAATMLAADDPAYREPATCLALAVLAEASIRTLAILFEVEPQAIVQSAGMSAAEFNITMERRLEETEE